MNLAPIARQALALLLLGIGVGAVNNLTAGKTRRLAWFADYPPGRSERIRAAADSTPLPEGTVETAPGAETASPPPAARSTGDRPPAPPATVSLPGPDPEKVAIELTPPQVDRLYDEHAIFLDARRTSQYEEGHIEGAHSFPIWETAVLEERIAQLEFLTGGDFDAPIVVYCNGGDCEDSHMLAEKLWAEGYSHVLIYRDGYPDWLDRGRPTARGPDAGMPAGMGGMDE